MKGIVRYFLFLLLIGTSIAFFPDTVFGLASQTGGTLKVNGGSSASVTCGQSVNVILSCVAGSGGSGAIDADASGDWSGSAYGTNTVSINRNIAISTPNRTYTFLGSCTGDDRFYTPPSVTATCSNPATPTPTPGGGGGGGGGGSPTVNLNANPTSVAYNGSSTLSWNSSNATNCYTNGGPWGSGGSLSLNSSQGTGSLTSNATYYIRCINGSQSATAQRTITVGSPGTPTPTPPPSNNPPFGSLDGANSGGDGQVGGWAIDPEAGIYPIRVHLYFDGPAGAGNGIDIGPVGNYRPDLVGFGYGAYHGFSYTIPEQYRDGNQHSVYAYGIDSSGGPATLLGGSPKYFTFPLAAPTCTSATPDGYQFINDTTVRIYANGVANATSVYFPTWSTSRGQDDLAWYPGVNAGFGTWYIDVNTALHPDLGPIYTHVYMYNVSYPGGIFCDQASLERIAPAPPTVNLYVYRNPGGFRHSPATVPYGTSAYFQWTSTGADDCIAVATPNDFYWRNHFPLNNPSPYFEAPARSQAIQDYTLTCTGPGGSASDTVRVYVAPYVDITSNLTQGPVQLAANWQRGALRFDWNSYAATSCSASKTGTNGWMIGSVSINQGDYEPWPAAGDNGGVYTMTCSGAGGTYSDSVTVQVQPSLTAALSANPTSAVGTLNTTLQATAGGSASGPMNYNFWWNCNTTTTNVGVAAFSCGSLPSPPPGTCAGNGNGYKCNAVFTNPQSAPVSYYNPGTYVTKVIIERDTATPAEARTSVTVNPNSAPSVTVTTLTPPDYCAVGPTETVTWSYSDPNNSPVGTDPQSSYYVQFATNASFTQNVYNTGIVPGAATTFTIPFGWLQYNTTYYVRVRVWDSFGQASAYSATRNFTTPLHAYPIVNFTYSPASVHKSEPVQFTDTSVANGGATLSSWSWTFTNGTPASSTQRNPIASFLTEGSQPVTLRVTDSNALSCTKIQNINVQRSIPSWKEVAPQ